MRWLLPICLPLAIMAVDARAGAFVSPGHTQPKQASGGFWVDVRLGTGDIIKPGDKLEVHYVGKLVDGTVFDSSVARAIPFVFTLGGGMVIKGWEQGLVGMREGGLRRLTLPPELAYGEKGRPPTIPPAATLIFEVELLRRIH